MFFGQLQLLASRQVNSLNCKFKSLAEEYLSGEYLSEEYLSGTSSPVQRCKGKGSQTRDKSAIHNSVCIPTTVTK